MAITIDKCAETWRHHMQSMPVTIISHHKFQSTICGKILLC